MSDRAYRIFFDALSKNSNEAIIEAASQLFDCPVLLTDENYKLLYQFPHKKIGEVIWDTLYDTGTLPVEVIWNYQLAFLPANDAVYEPFYENSGLVKSWPRIFGEIYTKTNQVLGHVAIFMKDRTPNQEDLEDVKILTEALAIRMRQKNANTRSTPSYLYDMLAQKSSIQRKLLARRILGERMQGNFSVMVLRAADNDTQIAFLTRTITHLNQSFTNTVSTLFEGCIVTLFGEIKGETYTQKEKAFLKRVAGSLPDEFLYAGISDPFSNLEDLRLYFDQAFLCAGLKMDGITFHEENASKIFFANALTTAAEGTYIHPVLSKIRLYDEKNETQYYQTLYTFCMNLFNKEKTLKELYIHRNTLLYRINRIEELFGLNLDDRETALYLLNSFQLKDFND